MAKKRKDRLRNRGGNPAKAHAPRAPEGAASAGGGQTAPAQRGAISARSAPTKTRSAPTKKSGYRRPKRWEMVVIAAVLALVVWGAWSWWSSRGAASDFESLVDDGRNRLGAVQTFPDGDRSHLARGQAFTYSTPFPTVGPHDPLPLPSGFYTRAQPATRLLHSLEHGLIVIYYDQLPEEQIDMIRGWTGLFVSTWSGVIGVPSPGLGSEVVASAWRRQMRQEIFDPAAIAAFIDLYTGRGPENIVR